MRVAVTGGNGFLGRHVVDALLDCGDEPIVVRSERYNLLQKRNCEQLFQVERPDAVVHLAARVGGIGDNVDLPGTFLYENAVMGLELMEAALVATHEIEKFLTVGTACMYPASAEIPMREDELWNGLPAFETASYAHAKRLILAQGQAYREQYDFPAIFVIPSNLYGPGDSSTHVVPELTRKFYDAQEEDEDVLLWGSGSATRDFLFASDAAEGIVAALHYYDSPEPVNLGTGVETSVAALAHAVAWEIDFKGKIRWDPTKPEGALRRALDTTRAREYFGWMPRTKLREGLSRFLEWFEGRSD